MRWKADLSDCTYRPRYSVHSDRELPILWRSLFLRFWGQPRSFDEYVLQPPAAGPRQKQNPLIQLSIALAIRPLELNFPTLSRSDHPNDRVGSKKFPYLFPAVNLRKMQG